MENQKLNSYLNPKDHYCYENGVLINKLDITNKEELDEAEKTIPLVRIANLSKIFNDNPSLFKFDQMWYLNIHKYIFQDIYPFAGDIRDVNIVKNNTPFVPSMYINEQMKEVLNKMKKKVSSITDRKSYVEFLAFYYGELNMIHPFREGNGRTLRIFLQQMVIYLNDKLPLEDNYILDYSNMSDELRTYLINGSIENALAYKTDLLEKFFDNTLKVKEPTLINKER